MSLYVGVLRGVGVPELFRGEPSIFKVTEHGVATYLRYKHFPNEGVPDGVFDFYVLQQFISTPIPLEQYLISRL